MTTFCIQPGNPYDFNSDELEDLLNEVRSQAVGADVVLQKKTEHGYGVTLYEVIQVVADVRGAGGDLVIGYVVAWMTKRWKRDKDAGRRPRPRSVVLLDLEGNVLRTIEIDEPNGEPHESRSDEV